jgi:hypothetical protein
LTKIIKKKYRKIKANTHRGALLSANVNVVSAIAGRIDERRRAFGAAIEIKIAKKNN